MHTSAAMPTTHRTYDYTTPSLALTNGSTFGVSLLTIIYTLFIISSKVFNISCAYHHLQKLLSGFLAGFQTASVDGRLFAVDARENFPKIPYQINSPYNFKKKGSYMYTCCISISYISSNHIL